MRVHTFADWMKTHPRADELATDKEANLARLISWDLYTLPHMFIESRGIKQQLIRNFCAEMEGRSFSVRALPQRDQSKRGTRIALRGAENVINAINEFISTGERFRFLIAAYGRREFVGNVIVSKQGNVIVEIMKSKHHSDLTQGLTDVILDYRNPHLRDTKLLTGKRILYVSGIDWTGCIIHHSQTPEKVRWIAANCLEKIRITRGKYITGYYEFVYSPSDGLGSAEE